MFREIIIDTGLEVVSDFSLTDGFHALEIGCMYTTKEGMSTFRIANFLRSHTKTWGFISIEYDPEHIAAAKEILTRRDASLLDIVEFVCGNSVVMLPEALEKVKPIDFALLDGGAHPEICLQEFELVTQNLSENGLIVVDDLQFIPSKEFNLRFGKGTLILPFLIINQYLEHHNIYPDEHYTGIEDEPSSALIKEILSMASHPSLRELSFRVVSKGNHRMLIVAREPLLDSYENKLRTISKTSYLVKLMLFKTRIKHVFEILLGRSAEGSINIT